MKTIMIILGVSIMLSGCSSHPIRQSFFENIHEGDSSEHVKEVMGEPDAFGPSAKIEGATVWHYKKRADVCGVAIKDNQVKLIGCSEDVSYVSTPKKILTVFGTILGGAGEGMQAASGHSSSSVSCTSFQTGSTVQTNCN